jgi:hypothetical protein
MKICSSETSVHIRATSQKMATFIIRLQLHGSLDNQFSALKGTTNVPCCDNNMIALLKHNLRHGNSVLIFASGI